MGGQGELSMCVHVCACVHVRVSTCMALPFPQSFGEGGNAAREAFGMLHQDEALGWLLLHGAGSSVCPLHQAQAANALPNTGRATVPMSHHEGGCPLR